MILDDLSRLCFWYKNKKNIKIYDCFLFFNENDILEIRLNELSEIVDYFVIVESQYTFAKKNKEFNFDIKRFEKFKDKIIYIQNNEFLRSPNPWDTEKQQRNKLIEGLNLPSFPKNACDNDLIILSDLDEIPKASKIIEAFYLIYQDNKKYIKFNLKNYHYALNNQLLEPNEWTGPICSKRKNIDNMQDFRHMKEYIKIDNAGWHYSFVNNIENIIAKMNAYSHQEYNKWPNNDPQFVKERIKSGHSHLGHSENIFRKVELNKQNCPKYVLKNKKKYDKIIFDHGKYKHSLLDKIISIWKSLTSFPPA